MEATTLLLPGSLEPQLGLSVAPLAEHVIRISALLMLFLKTIDEDEGLQTVNGS
jgi:hypothetical protein